MPDMDAPGRVGEHLEHVVFRPRIIVFRGEDRLFVPLALPARLGITGVVAFGGHGIVSAFCGFGSGPEDGGLGHKSGCGVNGLGRWERPFERSGAHPAIPMPASSTSLAKPCSTTVLRPRCLAA